MSTELDQMLIERACERLIIDSAAHNDRKEWEALASLYTTDGVITRPSGEQIIGREAIVSAYAGGPADRFIRHACVNLRVHVDDADNAHATTVVVVYSGTRQPDSDETGVVDTERQMLGEFVDRFRLTDEGWKISSREAYMVMAIG